MATLPEVAAWYLKNIDREAPFVSLSTEFVLAALATVVLIDEVAKALPKQPEQSARYSPTLGS